MRILLVLWLPACSTVRVEDPESTTAATTAAAADAMEGLWVLQIRRQQWQPRDLEFVLRIEQDGSGTATLDPVFIGRTTAALSDLASDGETVRFSLQSKVDDNVYRFEGSRDGGTLDGLVRWHDDNREQTEPFTGYRREVRRFDDVVDSARFRVQVDPLAVGVSPVLLDRLVLGAETARSDSLIVLADGQLVAARTFGGTDVAMFVGSLAWFVRSLPDGAGADLTGPRPSDIAAMGQQLISNPRGSEPASPWTARPNPNDEQAGDLGFGHLTSAGEGLMIYPEARLVVVRTLRRVENGYDRRYDARDGMEWLDQMADTIALEKLGHTERR